METQEAEIEEYCRNKGYQLTEIYIDRGITARKNLCKREAFMRLMADVQSGKINHIVVLRLDRFFRNVYDYHRMMNEFLIPNGCEWSAIKEDYDTTTTNGRLMINLRLAIAEQECDQDSDRIKDVFDRRAAEGYFIGGGMPYGYKAENKRLVVGDNGAVVTDIFDTFSVCNSVKKTMLQVNARHSTTLSYWIVRKVLSNRIYLGEYRNCNNYCPPLTTPAIYEACQRGLQMNVKVRSNHRAYPFAGLLCCSECGRILTGVSSCDKYDSRYYRCNRYYLNRTCPNNHAYSQNLLEDYLLKNIESLLSNYILSVEVKEKNSAPIKGNRDLIEGKISRLKDMFVNGIIDMDELKSRRAELESQIIEDVIPPKKDLSSVKAFLESDFRTIYNGLTDEEKQILWRSVIDRIVIDRDKIKDIIFL